MKKYLEIKDIFEKNKDEELAIAMAKYMKNKFSFYGIPAPRRRQIYKNFLNIEKKNKIIDWDFLNKCYENENREFQYLVYDYLLNMKKFIKYDDIPKIKYFILNKSWWDTIDFLDKVIGNIALNDSRVNDLMLEWSKNDNIWLKRVSIDYQLSFKEKTNTEYLEMILINCLGTDEFFINKSIGWSLRDYSKTNPKWVKKFIEKYKDKMDKVSIKEAIKYI